MSEPTVEVTRLHGPAIRPWLPAIAELRLAVFREWPYLYDGDLAYETDYLAVYAAAPSSVVVLARAGDRVLGCATAIALADEQSAFREPIERAGYDVGCVYYFGESVLLPAWRGRGLGHRFFDEREAAALAWPGIRCSCFAAVERAPDDPRCPAGYRSLHPFWQGRGYRPLPGVQAHFDWREIGAAQEQSHRLNYWMRELR